MIKNSKTLKDRYDTKKHAFRIIDDCIKNGKGFMVFTTGNEDVISATPKELYVMIGALLTNSIKLYNDNPSSGYSKEELQRILDKANELANEKDEDENNEDNMKSVNDYLIKVLEDLKNKIKENE